jgi:regulator of replication initiation timing
MNIEKLEELQRDVNAQRLPGLEDCSALIGEVWRLKTAMTAKDLEIGYLRDGYGRLEAELRNMIEANQLLRAEVDQLKAVHGLPQCDLENRWSNCAVRMRKSRETGLSVPVEMVDDGTKLNRGNSRLRRFTHMLFKNTTRHRSI